MKRYTLMAVVALLLLPAASRASHDVNVEVRVNAPLACGWDFTETRIDFRPECGAFVALYAAWSDGSVHLVFPAGDWRNHWVEPGPAYSVAVRMPAGVRLESVQAVASRHWFDPSECWVTVAPLHHGEIRPSVTVVTHSPHPVFTWNFAVSWGSSHRYEWVRSGCRQPVIVVPTAGGDAAHPRTHRWTSGNRPDPSRVVKVKAGPGTKSSKPLRDSGEPKRRSGR